MGTWIVGTNAYLSVQFDYMPAQGVSTDDDDDVGIDEHCQQPQQSLEIVTTDRDTTHTFSRLVPNLSNL